MSHAPRRAVLLAFGLAAAMILPSAVSATHSWGSYHWARTTNPFTVNLGDNVSAGWDSYLGNASSDWTSSTVLDAPVAKGTSVKRLCSATTGTVQICNSRYGNNGWLGMASIWASGSHITKATVKLNDTYYGTATYNTPAWRAMVMCQEIGHTFGLNHQDENFNNANLGTCMDYTGNPESNQHPNQGDYDELLCIYDPATTTKTTETHSCTGTGHLDSTSTVGSLPAAARGIAAADEGADAAWGKLVEVTNGGHGAWYVRDLGAGNVILTHVLWADR